MKDPRSPILVRSDSSGFVDGNMTVETVSCAAQQGTGLYLMVPVQNEAAADVLAKRLSEM